MQSKVLIILSSLLPYHSGLRRLLKVAYQDARTLARMPIPWREYERKPPRQLTLETTNACNADCVFCAYQYQSDFRQGIGCMPDELFQKVLEQYKEISGRNLSFTPVVGDPLLDPDILQRLKAACDAGFHVSFHTNGLFLDRIDLDGFVRTGIKELHLSTAPFDPESHKLLYRTDHYDELIRGVTRLLEARNSFADEGGDALRFSIEFRAHIPFREVLERPDFKNKVLPLLTQAEESGVAALVTGFDTWGGQINEKDLPGMMRLAIPPRVKRRPCALTFSPQVLWDGKVRACPCYFGPVSTRDARDDLFIGDLNEESLSEIWHGDRIRRLRRRFASGDLPALCKKCTMYSSC